MQSFRTFREIFRADMMAAGCKRRGIIAGIWYFLSRYDYSAVLFFRLSAYCYRQETKLGRCGALLFWRLNTLMNACDMRPQANVGPGLQVPHPVGIVLGWPVTIGKNVYIHQNVTLGRKDTDTEKTDVIVPITVGDNVAIYCGAVIMGGANVGDNCEIGANSVVAKEVPANSIAIGVPARIIRKPDAPSVESASKMAAVEPEKSGLSSRPAAVDGQHGAGDVRRSVAG